MGGQNWRAEEGGGKAVMEEGKQGGDGRRTKAVMEEGREK